MSKMTSTIKEEKFLQDLVMTALVQSEIYTIFRSTGMPGLGIQHNYNTGGLEIATKCRIMVNLPSQAMPHCPVGK